MRFTQPFGRLNLSLRSKMVFGGILILLIPLAIIGSATFIKSSRTLETISSLQLIQVAESLSGMIQIALEKDLGKLTSVATEPQIVQNILAHDYTSPQQTLSRLYQLLSNDFEGIAIYDTSGTIRADGVDETRVGISIAERNYFLAAKEGHTGVGPMISSKATGAPVFGLSAPIFDPQGKFIGGVLGVVKAEYLTQYIASLELGRSGYAFMTDQEGTIVAHPDKKLILTTNIKDTFGTEVLAAGMIRQKTKSVEYQYDGQKKVAGICPVALTGWSIGACQDKDEIMALAYSNMAFLLLVSSFFIILIILAVLFFSKTISVPVQTTLTTLNYAIEQAAEAFLIIGNDGMVQFANPATSTLVERPISHIVGKPFPSGALLSIDDSEIVKAMEDNVIWSGNVSGTRQDDAGYTMALTLTPILNVTGKFMGYLAVGRDITKELILQEQLQQSQKMEAIGTLAGGIAHDFNNILSAIFGYTELASYALDNPKQLEIYLNHVLVAAKRARDLVSHILTFSRKSEFGRKAILPKYVIKDTLMLLRASLPSNIEIRDALMSSAAIMGNDIEIHQMTMNLCSNAGYELAESGGVLTITLDETVVGKDLRHQYPDLHPGKYLRLQVADSGGGIPADVQERMFDPFFTTKPIGQGTGLGLSVVHGIVKSLGGEIMVTSKIGKGSIFTILLPIVEARIPGPEEVKQENLPRGEERVLLVDDEEAIVHSMQTLLENLGYQVRAFTRSQSALDAFEAHPDAYDVIITDYTMPGLTGVSLSEKIRSLRPRIPIILCSGHSTLKAELETLQPIEFVRKPIIAGEIARTLRKALDAVKRPAQCDE